MTITEIYNELIEKIKRYHPTTRLSLIERAYEFARAAHENQMRISGEPYIIHPLSVAVTLAELELDLESIAAGILHDVVEDTPYTYEDIVTNFGEEIAQLVDGVTKLDEVKSNSEVELKAENYRKMFLAMAKDIRVILIKIADRLHNLRTIDCRTPEKQRKVAQETLDIYAPLAHRLGISRLRYELEDLSFKHLDPDAYNDLAEKIKLKQSERYAFVAGIVEEVKQKLEVYHIKAAVEGRPKHFFSIYKKMVGKNKTLDQIFDLFAVRVLVNEIRECYEVLGMLHELYTPVPGRFKDYIGMPKSNRYQSLHTTLIGQQGEPFEVQIRTGEMHRVSEFGIAAHWKYKEGKCGEADPDSEEAKHSWLREILDWQRDLSDSQEYLEALKRDLNVFKDHVYCFTPKGEVISLISGSTPIDFAYAIHSAVGNKMVGARVNNKLVPFDYPLSTGERVFIVTSQNARGPGKDWINLVKTSQAKSKIKQWFKRENRTDSVLRGRELLEKEAKKTKMTLSALLSDGRESLMLSRFNYADMTSLYAAVDFGGVKEGHIIHFLFSEYRKTLPPVPVSEEAVVEALLANGNTPGLDEKKPSGIIVKGIDDKNVRFAKCCSPLPEDEIVGFITRGRGVSIHRSDCGNILHLDEINRMRITKADWQVSEEDTATHTNYHADLRIFCYDREGLLMDLSRMLSEEKVKVQTLNARTTASGAVFKIGIEVVNRRHLNRLCDKLLRVPGVQDIERVSS